MIRRMRIPGGVPSVRRCVAQFVLALVAATSAGAQASVGGQSATRSVLSARADSLESQLTAGDLRGKARDGARAEVAALRARLSAGDFQVGDRFVLTIESDNIVRDTALVRDGLSVAVPTLPDASLQGVLRAELTEHMAAHVGRYLKNATVRTLPLTRISVVGASMRPGLYFLPPDRPLGEVIMVSGGGAANASQNSLEVRRGGRVILSKRASKRALSEGRTLEELGIQSGDEIRVPTTRRINWSMVLQIMFIASSLLFAYLQFLQWYYRDDG